MIDITQPPTEIEIAEALDVLRATGSDCAGVVRRLAFQRDLYQAAIRNHRDQRGDDRCWMDDERLYGFLPEGYIVPVRDTVVELSNCERFIRCRQNPGTVYVSPQREIEELRIEVSRLTAENEQLVQIVERMGRKV